MRLGNAQIPDGYLTPGQVAARIGVTDTAVRLACDSGRLPFQEKRGCRLIKDTGNAELTKAFPTLCTAEGFPVLNPSDRDYQKRLMYRWMVEHDICSIGERAVRETA